MVLHVFVSDSISKHQKARCILSFATFLPYAHGYKAYEKPVYATMLFKIFNGLNADWTTNDP
jgi:hypothetical protein